jgi:hypothetical protein
LGIAFLLIRIGTRSFLFFFAYNNFYLCACYVNRERMKRFCLSFGFCLFAIHGLAQHKKDSGNLTGRIVSAHGYPLPGTEVTLPLLKLWTVTDSTGRFIFKKVPYGEYEMHIGEGSHTLKNTVEILVDLPSVDLGDLAIGLSGKEALAENVFPDSLKDTVGGQSFIPSRQETSAGLFPALAARNFSFVHYQRRGYGQQQQELRINGLLMNDPASGLAPAGIWNGIREMRGDQFLIYGLGATKGGFGGLAGLRMINVTAAVQRQCTRVRYERSNADYGNEVMAAHNTGWMKNGWAVSVSGSRRWAKESYVPGCFYDGYAYFLGLSKKLGKSQLHFTAFGAAMRRGNAAAVTKEAMDLTGSHYYNPNWGALGDRKRNASVRNTFRPVFLLNYEFSPNATWRLKIAAACQFGYEGNSGLDWYNAQDPRPDYYRNMPSYYLNNAQGADLATAIAVRQQWLDHPEMAQINWDRLYEVNRLNFETVNGTSGRRSLYVIGQDRQDIKLYSFSGGLEKSMGKHVLLDVGLDAQKEQTEYYRKMLDLLGGDYYVNLNQFAERTYIGNPDFKQNDLNHPDEIIRKGDKYDYDYDADFLEVSWRTQLRFTYNKVDFFAAARLGLVAFSRNGRYRNGLFPDNSYGKSEPESFFIYALKGGITYKISSRHYLFVHGAYGTSAPEFQNTFYSPRSRNASVEHPEVQKYMSVEGAYVLRTPVISGSLAIFATDSKDAADILRFYHEAYRTFVNYVMQGISLRHTGAELAFKVKLSPSFSATALAGWMQVFYTSRPYISVYRDNDTSSSVGRDMVYWKNYFATTGPQSIYSIGLHYNDEKQWYAGLNLNYCNRAYEKMNPTRLTPEAVDMIPPGTPQWKAIVSQEKLPAAFSINCSLGKAFSLPKILKRVPGKSSLYIGVRINNILDNKNILGSAVQQLRFDYGDRDPQRFPTKYRYAYGRNYVFNVSLSF